MLELVDLTDWKTKKEILRDLAIKGIKDYGERQIRLEVEHHNSLWEQGERDMFIAHSQKGYKLTNDAAEIMGALEDYKARAVDQFAKCWKYSKHLNKQPLLTIDELLKEVVE